MGGAIKRLTSGNHPTEYDICTNATPNEVIESFDDTIYLEIWHCYQKVNTMFNTTLRTETGYGDEEGLTW